MPTLRRTSRESLLRNVLVRVRPGGSRPDVVPARLGENIDVLIDGIDGSMVCNESYPVRLWLLVLFAGLVFVSSPAIAQEDDQEALPSIAEKTEGMEAIDGFVPLYWEEDTGTLWMEISRFEDPFLYYTSLVTGLGSNPVGLDRGQTGGQRLVQFERYGPKVHLVAKNTKYRATTRNPDEERAVTEAFASGVLWGFDVAAEGEEGHSVLVDATDFIVRDAYGVVERLKETDQGSFTLDDRRSTPYLKNTKAFPRNTEMEARLTYTTDEEPGEYVQETAADPYAVTLRVRYSFAQLPDTSGYEPRLYDPRSGYGYTYFQDYTEPIGTSMDQRLINRHRLTCAEAPGEDGVCPVEEPIVYYLDRGTPEPVRSALLEGARWWADAFEAAGYENAFRVEMLPEEADPMDIRYNVIQWVHRRTRGWSYGLSVTDPRTGEILKGDVTLGSRRVRQDYLLAEGLLAPYEGEHADGFRSENDPMLKMALARIRQLSAHEIGHTLGLAHNFAASATPGERASVMDYPAPLARVENDTISLDEAYDTGVGSWDILAIRYGYENPAPGQSKDDLFRSIFREQKEQEIGYITDQDARPDGAAHPKGHLWDNGTDAVEALENEMEVRRYALDRFGERVIQSGEPMALMEEVLVPVYLRHRYQVTATSKLLGGVGYDYALRGENGVRLTDRVSAEEQEAALAGLLETIDPPTLALPKTVRERLPPRPPGHPDNRELFDGYTSPTLDVYAPGEVAASMVLSAVVQPERAMRLIAQHDENENLPSLRAVLSHVTDEVWKSSVPDDRYHAELQRTVQQVWTDVLLSRADESDVAPAVQARVRQHLGTLADWLDRNPGASAETQAHRERINGSIRRFLERNHDADVPTPTVDPPPGDPIGQGVPHYLQRQNRRQSRLDEWVPARPRCFQ